jgi:hypothetical protein
MRHRHSCLGGRFLGTLLLALPLLFLPGCSDKNDSDAGTGPGPGDDSELDAIRQQALDTISFVNEFVDDAEAYSQGDLSGATEDLGLPSGSTLRAGEQPEWVDERERWELVVQDTVVDANGTTVVDVLFWVQYIDPLGLAQYEPDSTTWQVLVDADMFLDMHAEDDGQVIDLELAVEMDMALGGLPDGPYTIDSTGQLDMAMLWSGFGEGDIDLDAAMAWDMEVLAPANGCPSGTMTITMEAGSGAAEVYTLDAVFDGDADYTWTMKENGVVVDSGTESAGCSPGVS